MNLANRIDDSLMSRHQVVAICVCMIINMMDGFDVLVVAFTAPSLAAEWNLTGTAIGTLFSAGLLGMTIGSLVLGPLADRYGRRLMVLSCLVVISLGMLASAFTQNVDQLTIVRLVTGLGIGGMLPSLNTIVAEFSSIRWRSFSVSFMQAGYPIGATLGGTIAAILIAQSGWRAVYFTAGLASCLMILVAWWRLPESFDYLVTRQPQGALGKVNTLLRNMGQSEVDSLPDQSGSANTGITGFASLLQSPGLAMTTLLLSLCFFVIMFSFYFVLNWTPKLLVDAGMSTSEGISGGVLLNIGGVVGALLLGYASARFGINKLIAAYMLLTAGLMVLFSNVTQFDLSMLVLTLMLGFFIFGSIVGLYALAPQLFPVHCRSSGIGIAVGVGRLGGVGSPLLAGYLFDQGWSQADGFTLFAAPLLLSTVLVLALTTGALSRKSP